MSRWITGRLCGVLALLGMVGSAGSAGAGEAYYLLMFAAQRVPNQPNYAHTFATFVKATWQGDGPCSPDAALEAHTISWLPANLRVRTGALRPECGHNFDLHETLRYVLGNRERVSLWGPYPIEPELYERALHQKAELESGTIQYKANDAGRYSDRVTNCIHAVSSIVDGPRFLIANPGFGESASSHVLKKLQRYVLSREPEPWVGSALGLQDYPIHYRDERVGNPLLGPLFRLLGGERGADPTCGPR